MTSDPQEKANLFNDFFYSSIRQFNNDNLNYMQFTTQEVYKILSGLKTNKATDPDRIPALFLKNCVSSLSTSLTYLFNWKHANVVPIHKKETRR